MQAVFVAFHRGHWIPNPGGRAVGIELPIAVRGWAGLRDLLTPYNNPQPLIVSEFRPG
jgi:hypothetical protein